MLSASPIRLYTETEVPFSPSLHHLLVQPKSTHMPSAKAGLANRYPTALVTGASSGIGRAIALRLLREGVNVVGTTRNPEQPDLPGEIRWLPFDGASIEGIDAFVSEYSDLLSYVSILINNAGSSLFGKASEIPTEAILAQQNLLYGAPVRLCEAVLGPMRQRGAGALVNVSSLAAIFQLPYMAHYSAGKAALSSYTRGLMLTEHGNNLTIIDFQPGDYKTGFNSNILKFGQMDMAQERAWKRLEENLAMGPAPDRAAEDLIRALHKGKSRTLRSGAFFQRVIAPLGNRLLPGNLATWAIRKYYKLA